MSKFLEYISEKTFKIGGDVDMVYKKIFHPYIKLLPDIDKFIDQLYNKPFPFMKSSELKSVDSKKSHELNPIKIQFGLFDSPMYIPRDNLIKLCFNMDAIRLYKTHKTKERIENLIGTRHIKQFLNELSPPNIKSTIYHELSHWINDTLHNRNIYKRIEKAQQTNDFDVLKKHGYSIFTDYELDAQVHAIKQLKRDYRKDWDKLTWTDLIEKKPSFSVIFSRLNYLNTRDQNEYFQRMIKRLNREGLLGKGLRNSFIKAVNNIS